MSVDISDIVEHNINIKTSGLAGADFQAAMLYVPFESLPTAFSDLAGGYLEIKNVSELTIENGFTTDSETYLAALAWLGGVPAMDKLIVYFGQQGIELIEDLDHAYQKKTWFWTFFLASYYTAANVVKMSTWINGKSAFLMVQPSLDSQVPNIRNPDKDDDFISTLNGLGLRNTATFVSADTTSQLSKYAGMALCKWFAAVDYSAVNSTITGEYKKLVGVGAENLTVAEIDAQQKKNAMWYGTAEHAGQVDAGRVFNSMTHSANGEFMDSVIDSMVLANDVQTSIYNVLTNTLTKLPYTPSGYQQALNKLGEVLQKYVDNGYLGEREITTSKGETKISVGFEIHSTANDILHVSDEDRSERKPPPIQYSFYPAGAIHSFTVTGDMF